MAAHTSYQHEAFLYRNLEEFLAGTVPFVHEAVAQDQPVMVALTKPKLHALQDALGDCGGVDFVDMGRLGGNPARIIPGWRAFIDAHGEDGPLRGIGEPQWSGRRPEEAVECQLHEGLLNVAVDPDTPLWLRCPYDVAALPEPLVEASGHSHPALVEVGSYRGSVSYEGLHHVDSLFRTALPDPPADCALLAFEAADLDAVRARVAQCADDVQLGEDRCRALVQAVGGIAADTARSGAGHGQLRTWTRADALICEVTNNVRYTDPMVGRRAPGRRGERGERLGERSGDGEPDSGLWTANQISDLVQVRSTSRGSSARVFAWL
jgi:hypothetical protein